MDDMQIVEGPSSPDNEQLQRVLQERAAQAELKEQVDQMETEAGRGVARLAATAPAAERRQPKNLVNRRRMASFAVLPKPTGTANHFGVVEGKVYCNKIEKTEDAGSPFSFYTNSFELTAALYGWIDYDEVAETWTMNTGAAVPAAAANHQIKRLFYLAWDAVNSKVDDENCEVYHEGDVEFEVAASTAYNALFDLFDVSGANFKIRGTVVAEAGGAWIAGVKRVFAESGITWNGATDYYWNGTISANSYVYVVLDRSANTATMTLATSLPNGTDTTRIAPLWYLPWSGSAIDTANIVDMRPFVTIPASA